MFRKYDNPNCFPVGPMDATEETRIRAYLLGAAHCWCKNRFQEWFTVQDLFGGDNRDWTDTPMIYLYERRMQEGLSESEAFIKAAQDAGNIFKSVLKNDVREYDTRKNSENKREYYWTGN